MLRWIKNKGLKLAVVSNWYQEELEGYLLQLDLLPFFDYIMSSEKAGTLKVDLKPFQQTLEALDVKPTCVLHVGDSITQDGSCRQLGIQFAYCTWYQKEHPEEPIPVVTTNQYDFTVATHRELLDVINTLL
jgi:putative hydrolase of the HAD superfamily